MLKFNQIYHGDCLEIMQQIDDKSIDLIVCDLPYGMPSRNKWDTMIPCDLLWTAYKRIIKNNGAITLTACQPFASMLIMSNLKMFRYDWVWAKNKSTGFLNANRMPLRNHESILVFYKKPPTYNPQKTTSHSPVHSYTKHTSDGPNYGQTKLGIRGGGQIDRYPTTIQYFKVVNNDNSGKNKFHPTQKPIDLFEYLIQTYSDKSDLVLDNCAGVFTTAVAADNLERNWICIEKEKEYCKIGIERINRNRKRLNFPKLT